MWRRAYVSGYKAHYVPEELFDALVQDLMDRDPEASLVEGCDIKPGMPAWCDQGGMVMVDEARYETDVAPGMTWATRARCFRHYLHALEDAEERRFSTGQPYYKIHGWNSCVVLSPAQRERLLQTMRSERSIMVQVETEMDERWSRTQQALNAHPNIDLPAFDGPIGGDWS